jgi:hypothetical protein
MQRSSSFLDIVVTCRSALRYSSGIPVEVVKINDEAASKRKLDFQQQRLHTLVAPLLTS